MENINGQKISKDSAEIFSRQKQKLLRQMEQFKEELRKDFEFNEEWDYDIVKRKMRAEQLSKFKQNVIQQLGITPIFGLGS